MAETSFSRQEQDRANSSSTLARRIARYQGMQSAAQWTASGPAAVLTTVIVHVVERGHSRSLVSHAGRCRGGRDGEIMASFDDNMLLSDRLRMAGRQCRACQTLGPTTTRVIFISCRSRYGGKPPGGCFCLCPCPQRRRPPNGTWHWGTFLRISLVSDVASRRMGSDEGLMAMLPFWRRS